MAIVQCRRLKFPVLNSKDSQRYEEPGTKKAGVELSDALNKTKMHIHINLIIG